MELAASVLATALVADPTTLLPAPELAVAPQERKTPNESECQPMYHGEETAVRAAPADDDVV